jgi:IclR family acetate operon transcriptional repressor
MDELAAGGELGTNELARRTGVNASTVSRLLATLAAAGYVDQAANGRYRLGIRLVQLGNAVVDRLDLREVARPELERLVDAVGETVTLSVGGEYEAITVDFARSPSSVQGVAQVGRPSVAHATATGKVMLAFGRATVPPGPLKRYTPRTIADPRGLTREPQNPKTP